jgi:hypothetical protein
MPFVFNDPLHWLVKASEARELAAEITDLGAHAGMLTIAEEYEKIAQRAAERLATLQTAKPGVSKLAAVRRPGSSSK